MQKDYEKVYHQNEQIHFWFRARRKCILQFLQDVPRSAKILDVGCSSGILLHEILKEGFYAENLYGVDISEVAIENCKSAGLSNTFVMDAQNITLTEKFDVLIASDCLEHLSDDSQALKNWYSLLKSGGILIVFVPAFMALWSQHDVANMHYTRYRKNELKKLIKQQNFQVVQSGYWNFLLFLPTLVWRFFSRISPSPKKSATGDLAMPPRFMNQALFYWMMIENFVLRFVRYPWGISAYILAKKL